MIRAVILDLDGTLVDTAEEIALALNETLAGPGLRVVSRETATALIGRGVHSLVARQLWLGWIADRRLSRDGGDDLS